MKNNQSFLGFWIRPFLTEYLITIKNYSINTVRSYRDSLSMFLIFIKDSTKKRMEQIRLEDITPTLVEKFLKSIEEQRKCSVSTRNQRLAAIHWLNLLPLNVRSRSNGAVWFILFLLKRKSDH